MIKLVSMSVQNGFFVLAVYLVQVSVKIVRKRYRHISIAAETML
jgi:hypothetical protein